MDPAASATDGCNDDFLRYEATLVTIITDEADVDDSMLAVPVRCAARTTSSSIAWSDAGDRHLGSSKN